jgi:hypothetical protein
MTTLLRVRLIYQTMYLMECADALQFVEAHFRMSDEASSFGNQIGPCGFSELAGHVGEGGVFAPDNVLEEAGIVIVWFCEVLLSVYINLARWWREGLTYSSIHSSYRLNG